MEATIKRRTEYEAKRKRATSFLEQNDWTPHSSTEIRMFSIHPACFLDGKWIPVNVRSIISAR